MEEPESRWKHDKFAGSPEEKEEGGFGDHWGRKEKAKVGRRSRSRGRSNSRSRSGSKRRSRSRSKRRSRSRGKRRSVSRRKKGSNSLSRRGVSRGKKIGREEKGEVFLVEKRGATRSAG